MWYDFVSTLIAAISVNLLEREGVERKLGDMSRYIS